MCPIARTERSHAEQCVGFDRSVVHVHAPVIRKQVYSIVLV